MNIHLKVRAAGALTLSLTLASAAALSAAPATSEFTWDASLGRGATVEIVNPSGDVFVQRSGSGRLEVHAIRTSATGNPDAAAVQATQIPGGYAICTEAPDAKFACDAGAKPSSASSAYRVDELVAVPSGTTVIVRARNGKIVVENADAAAASAGELRATIVAGDGKSSVFTARDGTLSAA